MKHLIQKVSLGNTINIIDLQRRNSLKKKQTNSCLLHSNCRKPRGAKQIQRAF